MPIAGAVVVPVKREFESDIIQKLKGIEEIEVKESGEKGIAVVLDSDDMGRLKDITEEIQRWEEVVEFSLAYLNWEDLENEQ